MRCLDPHVTLLNAIDELLWIEFHVAGWNLEQLLRLRSFLNVRHLDGGAVIGLELHDEVDAGIDPYEIPVLARRDSPVFNGAAPRSTRRRCARNAMWGLDWSHQRFAPMACHWGQGLSDTHRCYIQDRGQPDEGSADEPTDESTWASEKGLQQIRC